MENQTNNQTPVSPAVPEKINLSNTHSGAKKILFLFIALITIVGSIAAGSYFYKLKHPLSATATNSNNAFQQSINPKTTMPNTTPTTQSTNPTMNIYQNNANKFSVPYPKNLTIKESAYGLGITNIEMRQANTPANSAADYQMLLFPKAMGAMIGQDFNNLYAMPEGSSKVIKDPSGASTQFTKGQNKTINGLRAFEFTSTSVPPDPQEEAEIGVYIETGNSITIISTGASNKATLDSMISQFKYPL